MNLNESAAGAISGLLVERAPAKINLTLQVAGRRQDGWHRLESLVAFTAGGDALALAPGRRLELAVSGAFATASGPVADNLVLRAARELAQRKPGLRVGAFHLRKGLPAAAGIGGGSSDAAAALRLLARHNGLDLADPDLLAAASAVGADVPVCLRPRARMMRGRGEELGPDIRLPPLFAVLVNPGVELGTRDVFARLNLAPGEDYAFSPHPEIPGSPGFDALTGLLRKTRNDLEDPASVLEPVVGDVLAVLGAARGCRLARMSGSGPTCFGLFADRALAQRAARSIRNARPGWWVRARILR